MFVASCARCACCEKLFCCSNHRQEHQQVCQIHCKKRPKSSPNKLLIGSTKQKVAIAETRLKQSLGRKRKHSVSSIVVPAGPRVTHRTAFPASPGERKVLKAVRGVFRKLQKKVPGLETIEEDERESDQQKSDNIPTPVANERGLDPYNEFLVGSLKDSPITILQSHVVHKSVLATPQCPEAGPKLNEIFKTSTPEDLPSFSGKSLSSERRGDDGVSPAGSGIVHQFGTDTKDNVLLADLEGTSSGTSGSDCSSCYKTPLLAMKTHSFPSGGTGTSPSDSEGSSRYYSTCSSFISPLALSSLPATPITSTTMFSSVKDVFRTFISRIPPSDAVANSTNDGLGYPQRDVDSMPFNKRMKLLAQSKIKSRPTYKGRYKKPASYVFNS